MATREFSKLSWLKSLNGLDITPAQFRVLVAVANYSDELGRNARPGNAALVADTRLSKKHVITCLRELERRGLLVVTEEGGRGGWGSRARTWSLGTPNSGELSTPNSGELSSNSGELSTTPTDHDQIKIRSGSDQAPAPEQVVQGVLVPDEDDEIDPDAEARELSEQLADVIGGYASQRPTPTRKWIAAFTDLMARENITRRQVEYVIDYLPRDDFWPGVIFDAPKFVEKYDQVSVKAKLAYRKDHTPNRHMDQKQRMDDQKARWRAEATARDAQLNQKAITA